MSLDTRAVFAVFVDEVKGSGLRWDERGSVKTRKMMGDKKSRKKGDFGVFGRIGTKYGYKVQAEWARLDQVWYDEVKLDEDTPLEWWWCEAAIEHENSQDLYDILYSVVKLTEFKARLKIGVYYPRDDFNKALDEMSRFISRSISPSESERYLILLGSVKDNSSVEYSAWQFDCRGNRMKIPSVF